MFTDGPVTPTRVEVLVEVLREFPTGLSRESLFRLLQPKGLSSEPEGADKREQAKATLSAALELELAEEKERVVLRCDKAKSTTRVLLEALDARVLCTADVEPYFALFYSFQLGAKAAITELKKADLVQEFVRTVFVAPVPNPFNTTKYDGVLRWYRYCGLGWMDPAGVFRCNPYHRLDRSLSKLFRKSKSLSGEEFVSRMAAECPELDVGDIFLKANPGWDAEQRVLSGGVAHALVGLHLEGRIQLHCGADSRGWSLERAAPPTIGTLQGDRVDRVDLGPSAEGGSIVS